MQGELVATKTPDGWLGLTSQKVPVQYYPEPFSHSPNKRVAEKISQQIKLRSTMEAKQNNNASGRKYYGWIESDWSKDGQLKGAYLAGYEKVHVNLWNDVCRKAMLFHGPSMIAMRAVWTVVGDTNCHPLEVVARVYDMSKHPAWVEDNMISIFARLAGELDWDDVTSKVYSPWEDGYEYDPRFEGTDSEEELDQAAEYGVESEDEATTVDDGEEIDVVDLTESSDDEEATTEFERKEQAAGPTLSQLYCDEEPLEEEMKTPERPVKPKVCPNAPRGLKRKSSATWKK